MVPAKADRFNLGNVVLRAAIYIDWHTPQVTDTSDPFSQIIDGIPLQIKHVNKHIYRPGFTFNPTNCNRLQTITSNILKKHGQLQERRRHRSR